MQKVSSFMRSGVAALGVLAAQLLADKMLAERLNRKSYGPGRREHKRLTNGVVSQVHAGGKPSRQVLRSEARSADKKGYRAQREHMRWVRKQERLVAHAG